MCRTRPAAEARLMVQIGIGPQTEARQTLAETQIQAVGLVSKEVPFPCPRLWMRSAESGEADEAPVQVQKGRFKRGS